MIRPRFTSMATRPAGGALQFDRSLHITNAGATPCTTKLASSPYQSEGAAEKARVRTGPPTLCSPAMPGESGTGCRAEKRRVSAPSEEKVHRSGSPATLEAVVR
jgi:hypothetical protein